MSNTNKPTQAQHKALAKVAKAQHERNEATRLANTTGDCRAVWDALTREATAWTAAAVLLDGHDDATAAAYALFALRATRLADSVKKHGLGAFFAK